MIEAVGVRKSFGPVDVLRRVDFRAGSGEVLLLLGDNGAGKTTLLRSILGVIDYEGSITVDGLDPLRKGKQVRSRIGYMPQNGGLHLDLTVGETIGFYSGLRNVSFERGFDRLASVELEHHRDRRVGELSVGLRQRLGFAVATLADPPVLLLDEPTASLDAASREVLVEQLGELAEAGKTIVLSTHSEHYLATTASRALRLEDGRLAA